MRRQKIRKYAAVTLSLLVGVVGIGAGLYIGGPVGTTFILFSGAAGAVGVAIFVGTTRHVAAAFGLLGAVCLWLTLDSYFEQKPVGILPVLFAVTSLVAFWRSYQYYQHSKNLDSAG